MKTLSDVLVNDFLCAPFTLIGQEWMLIAAEKNGAVNAMTASWGGLGVLWSKSVAMAFIRPQRFTREFVDAAEGFSLNFFAPAHKEMMNYFGTVSGRDEDKVAKSGLAPMKMDGLPYFPEAKTVLLCKKLYSQPLEKRFFHIVDVEQEWYPEKDHHIMYIGEVTRVLAAN